LDHGSSSEVDFDQVTYSPYSVEQMARRYPPTARIAFGDRYSTLFGEQAIRISCRLVTLNHDDGIYSRVQVTPADEVEIIGTATHRASIGLEPRSLLGNRLHR
jgi:hypothetical protein